MTSRSRRLFARFLVALILGTAIAAHAAPAAPPATMRAAAIDRLGAPHELTVHEVPVPSLAPDEVLIAIDTAGVAVWDAEIRGNGFGSSQPPFPLTLGTDGAGTIAATGSAVRGFKIGDAVYSYGWNNPKGGFYAEYVVVAAKRVGHVPKGVDMLHAGAMGTTALTAIQGIDDALHLRNGEAVLIHGASGGVGTLAIQFAKLRGARVLATASGEDAVALVRRLGADAVVDSRSGDVAAAARRFAPRGLDAVLALVGGAGLEACAGALRAGGRLAYPEGVQPEPKPRAGVRIISYNAIPGVAQYARLNRAIETMPFEVPIAAEYPLAGAAAAHERLAAGHVLGKIVLRVKQ
jgi:NADPH:quinone reductase-like Zn-dependent oxidoreductase